jgi:hypothetical protein
VGEEEEEVGERREDGGWEVSMSMRGKTRGECGEV